MVGSRNSRASALVLALFLLISLLVVITATPGPADASAPGTNGKIVYERDFGIYSMNADGTGVTPLWVETGVQNRSPVVSPDGTKIALSSDKTGASTGTNIWVMNIDGTGRIQRTFQNDIDTFRPTWSPDGLWLAYDRDDGFELTGTAGATTTATTLVDLTKNFTTSGVAPGMRVTTGKGTGTVATVGTTTLTLTAPGITGLAELDAYTISRTRLQLYVVNATGATAAPKNLSASIIATPPLVYSDYAASWSPNGDKLAFATGRGGAEDIYVATIDAGAGTLATPTNLTPDPAWPTRAWEPEWSPDATKIAFQSPDAGFENIWVMPATGVAPGQQLRLTNTTTLDGSPTWSPDGTNIVFHRDGGVPYVDDDEELIRVPAGGGAEVNLTNSAGTFEKQPSYQRLNVATDDTYAITVGGSINSAAPGVMANDVGLGGNPLATATVVAAPTHAVGGSFVFNPNGSFTYTHDGSANDDSFTYRVTTPGGNLSNIATVAITIPGNPPVANPDAYDVEKGGTLTVPAPGVLGNDTDSEDGQPTGAVLKTAPAHAASFTLNANGSFTYVHDGSAGTSDTFTYQAKDSGNKLSNVATVTITITSDIHTVVLVDPSQGMWHLYDAAGVEKTSFFFGNPGDYPIYGDWNCDGIETPGMYRQSDGYVYLRNTNTQGPGDIKFFFGNPGDVPIAGDFNGNGCDTVSIYRPSNQTFYIINVLGQNDGGLGAAEFSYVFGDPGDKPFVGDFDGNGTETVGLHRESTGLVYFRNSHTQGNADNQFIYGDPGDRLVAGDWNGNGVFSPALFRPSNTTMYFRYTNTQGNADAQWTAGSTSWLPVSGNNGLG